MPVHLPDTVDAAVAQLAEDPTATVLAGGTDLMVEVNDGHRRPDRSVVVVNRIAELGHGDATPRTDGHDRRRGQLPGDRDRSRSPSWSRRSPQAARTVGSPQIRHAGTLGGNVGTCSPAGDGLPVLAALDAVVELAGRGGRRTMPFAEFMVGPKRTALRPGELIVAVTVPVRRRLAGLQRRSACATRW